MKGLVPFGKEHKTAHNEMQNDTIQGMIEAAGQFSSKVTDEVILLERNKPTAGHCKEAFDRLSPFFREEEGPFSRIHIEIFLDNMRVGREKTLGRRFTLIPIEPMQEFADMLREGGLHREATLVQNVHDMCLALRRWSQPFRDCNKIEFTYNEYQQ